MYSINFIAYAYDKKGDGVYESFLIPFTFFALIHNENSHVEIIVINKKRFISRYENEIKELKSINSNFLIREPQYKMNKHIPNTYRFFETPTIKSEYTYISDVDIMFLENVLPTYKQNWTGNLCFNNMLRTKDVMRLTGVHMVKTDDYYTEKMRDCQRKYYNLNVNMNDEVVLAKMCKEVYGLPNFEHRFRPILGIHFSPNRGKGKIMSLKTTKRYYDSFMMSKTNYPNIFAFEIFDKLINDLKSEFIITL